MSDKQERPDSLTWFEDRIMDKVDELETRTQDNSERIQRLETIAESQLKFDEIRDQKLDKIQNSIDSLNQTRFKWAGTITGIISLITIGATIGGIIFKLFAAE